ncbi:MAG TPA: hypothetical protein VJH37_04970 [Candidatus Nanoarchaeia archaeon]|nr:hypothetical protein [Candidatus Nanoarchaeia archaeon]
MKTYYSKILKRFLISILLFFILLFVSIYFWQQERTSDFLFKYNGFQFQQDSRGYKVMIYINEQDTPTSIHLREDPRTLEDIPVEGDIQLLRDKKQIYVTLDPEANLTGKTSIGALEIDAIIDNPYLFNIPVSSSFTKPYLNNTIRTCADVNAAQGVILFQINDRTVVREEQGCIYIEAVTEEDIMRASDRLVYTLLKIMQP